MVCGLLSFLSSSAQSTDLPLGAWRLHLPNNRAKAIAETPETVYCVTEDSFYKLVKESNALQPLSRTNGLSDVGVSTVAYDSASATLVIAYENTNLDLVQNGKVYNLTDLYRKAITGTKSIYHLYTHGKTAYLSTSFGLVVLDLVKHEVKDTYSNLGSQGEAVQVYASTVLHDSLYLATSAGVLAARQATSNLLDYRNWRLFQTADGLSSETNQIKTIASFQGAVYVGVPQQGVYRYNGQSWQRASFSASAQEFRSLATNGNRLTVAGSKDFVEVKANGEITTVTNSAFQDIRLVLPARAGGQWVVDYEQGLMLAAGNQVQAFVPNGPAFVNAFRLYTDGNTVTVLGGGYSATYVPQNTGAGFYQWQEGQWRSYNQGTIPQLPATANDFVAAVKNPVTGKFYLVSYTGGLLEWAGPDQFTLFNAQNSPLRPSSSNLLQVSVTDVAVDRAGSTWVVNRNQQYNAPGLLELKPDGAWVAHPFSFTEASNLERIIIDDQGYKWLSVSRRPGSAGLVVYDDEQQQYRYLSTAGMGSLPDAQVYSLALDNNGEVWVGTGNGVAVFANPANIFSPAEEAYLPVYERRPLLQGQVVQSIAVDGGNRKWIGTSTGLWLFNETGEQLIASFTTQNSPLPSNQIKDIAINHQTGEVFVATEAGVVSCRGAATRTEAVHEDCLQVFPNPVRVGFTGTIGISGIPNNGWVKITDAAGLLVYEGRANGGTFAWNGVDYKGRKAKSGVYLVLATSSDGTQTCSTKIAVQ